MSIASPLDHPPSLKAAPGVQYLERLLVEPLRFAGFWTAVTLPFVMLALVVAGVAGQHLHLVAGLLGANLIALRLGREYNRE